MPTEFIGHHALSGSPVSRELRLKRQSEAVAPCVSENYCMGILNFRSRLGEHADWHDDLWQYIPEDWFASAKAVDWKPKILPCVAINITAFEHGRGSKEAYRLVDDFVYAMHKAFNVAVISDGHRRKNKVQGEDWMLICPVTKLNLTAESHEDPIPKAAPQFYAMLVAKGWVEEGFLYERGLLLGKRNYEYLVARSQLEALGIQPTIDQPLHRATERVQQTER